MQKDFAKPTESVDWYVDPTFQPLPIRIDLFLKLKMITRSRTQIQSVFKKKRVLVNSKPVNPSYKLRGGENIRLLLDPSRDIIDSDSVKLEILYEDEHLVALNKEPGIIMHPAGTITSGTLLNAVHSYYEKQGSNVRPSLLQRLDKHTSGIVLMPKSPEVHAAMQTQIIEHTLDKIYIALCDGIPNKKEDLVEAPIDQVAHPFVKKMGVCTPGTGKDSQTRYNTLMQGDEHALLGIKLYTGRQHQIRVHMSHIGHPLTGDVLYGGCEKLSRQALHSYYLRFYHPIEKKDFEIIAPLPDDMMFFLQNQNEKKAWQKNDGSIDISSNNTLWNPKPWLEQL